MKKPKNGNCCADEECNSGRRNRFHDKKRNNNVSWQVEQDYHQQRRRLINRAVHGWGVVYGFGVALGDDAGCGEGGHGGLMIGEGFALDACGRELVQACAHRLAPDDCLLFGIDGKRVQSLAAWTPEDVKGRCLLLKAHFAEKLIAPVLVSDPCQDERTTWDEVCETVRYSLTLIECEDCCKPQPCALECGCPSDDDSNEQGCCPQGTHRSTPRGGCRCLCDHLTGLDPTPDCCELKAIDDKTLRVDLHRGVPLACVRLYFDGQCQRWNFFGPIDACGPRRLVKRNDLLFDLIRGCDLTTISDVSWRAWHRNADDAPVPFADFEGWFKQANPEGESETQFLVEFSRPVDVATITPDAFAMTVFATDDREGWGQPLRVPIVRIAVDDTKRPGYSKVAGIVVDAAWARGVFDKYSVFAHLTRIEIEVRGDYLLDCNGQAVDANARGREAAPTGNGTPGGHYFSTFLVDARKDGPSDKANSRRGT